MFDKYKLIDIIKSMSEEDYAAFAASLSSNTVLTRYSADLFDPLYENATYITDFLLKFGFNVQRDGFKYLRTSIGMMLHESEFIGDKLMSLYTELGKRYGVNWNAAERAMRYSIHRVYDDDYHRFDCLKHPWKYPTLGEFLSYSADQLK